MRILFVTQIVPFPPHGGVLQRGFNILKELGRNHEIHLLAFHHPDELPPGDAVERSVSALGTFCKTIEYFPLWPKRSTLHKRLAFAMGALYPGPFSVLAHANGRLSARMRDICLQRSTDIVHLDTIALAPYRQQCGSLPVVMTHHNIESQLMARRAQYESSAVARLYIRTQAHRLARYERRQCSRFPLNIVVSDADRKALENISPGSRIAVVPNGVDTDYFRPTSDRGQPCLIYTGGMNMFANRDAVEWFIDKVWPLVRKAVPTARFVAIGRDPSPRVLQAARDDASLTVPGFVDDIRPWVSEASVYVVPLRVGGGTRLKMVDAMAQGKAIVATTLGAEGIDATPGRHFVVADRAEDFAAEVIALLADTDRRRRLGAAAREVVEQRYGWPTIGRRLESLYADLLEEERRP